MAYNAVNLTFEVRTSLNHFVWDYSSSDNISTIEGNGYFSSHPLRAGDILRVTAGNDNVIYQVVDGDSANGVYLRKLATGITSFVNSVSGP